MLPLSDSSEESTNGYICQDMTESDGKSVPQNSKNPGFFHFCTEIPFQKIRFPEHFFRPRSLFFRKSVGSLSPAALRNNFSVGLCRYFLLPLFPQIGDNIQFHPLCSKSCSNALVAFQSNSSISYA